MVRARVTTLRAAFRLGTALGLLALFLLTLGGCDGGEPKVAGGPPSVRLLSESQYRQTIADIFGADILVGGGFEPDTRIRGLLAVGSGVVTVSPAGLEQYEAKARSIAAQALDEKHRGALLPCQPESATAPDANCAEAFFRKIGRLVMRRPLASEELARSTALAGEVAARTKDFHAGLQYALARLLVQPEFLFRIDVAEPDPGKTGQWRLTGLSKAERLSFLLWNAAPDDALLTAAETGRLDTPDGLAQEVDRLLASPRLAGGVRAFFIDFLGFDGFQTVTKDVQVYPTFNQLMIDDAQEQTLRTVIDHLVTRDGDYRDLFTTRHTFMNRRMGILYGVKVANPDGWLPYAFPAGDARAGLLTQVSFTALNAHAMRSSAVLRGKAVRELLLCQTVPPPPNNVDFRAIDDPRLKTARAKLDVHRTDPVCAGCHKITDPVGLALENFDGMGQFRATENGVIIDASGDLDGTRFADAAGLGQALHDSPAATSCLVNSTYRYAAGRDVRPDEAPWVGRLVQRFAADGYRLPALLRRIATSDAFYAVTPTPESPTQEAKL